MVCFSLPCRASSPGLSQGQTGDRVGQLLGRCPNTVRPVLHLLVFQLGPELLGKQQNRALTTSSTVLEISPNRTRTKRFPCRRALRQLPSGTHRKWALSQLGTVQETLPTCFANLSPIFGIFAGMPKQCFLRALSSTPAQNPSQTQTMV